MVDDLRVYCWVPIRLSKPDGIYQFVLSIRRTDARFKARKTEKTHGSIIARLLTAGNDP